MEIDMNREFGAMMADCCDEAILVGRKRSEAISLRTAGRRIPGAAYSCGENLPEAAELLKTLVTPGDTYLFENDLPDNYSEE